MQESARLEEALMQAEAVGSTATEASLVAQGSQLHFVGEPPAHRPQGLPARS